MILIESLKRLHETVFGALERQADSWLLGFAARFVFLAVLYGYYLNSALLKLGDGLLGFLQPSFGAYIQILSEQGLSAYDFDIANVPLHLKLIVFAGTYAEFILPALVVAGLFTRMAALGMIGFIAVQTFVDIRFHGADDTTIGSLFDKFSDSLISDQRTLWIFLLFVLVAKGAGALSLDGLIARRASAKADVPVASI